MHGIEPYIVNIDEKDIRIIQDSENVETIISVPKETLKIDVLQISLLFKFNRNDII